MYVNSASSSVSAVSLAYITSPDDALDLNNATQSDLTDQMRNAISTQVSLAASLVDRLVGTSQILNRLQNYGTGSFKPVTVELLAATPKTSDSLKSLFLNNGPSLGADEPEAGAAISDLSGMGIKINAPRLTPILVNVYDKKGVLQSNFFLWVNDVSRNSLPGTPVKSTTYPGANEQTVKSSDGMAVYYSFDQYAKFTPSQTDVNTAITQVSLFAKSLEEQIAATLDDATKASDNLQKIIDDNADTRKNQSQQISAMAAQQQQQLAELLNKLKILKIERDTSMRMQEKKIGPEVSSIVKNSTDRVESVSRVNEDMVGQISSGADENDSALQLQRILASLAAGQNTNSTDLLLQQGLTSLAAGPNTNTPENRIPV